jgi:hypothetical protein
MILTISSIAPKRAPKNRIRGNNEYELRSAGPLTQGKKYLPRRNHGLVVLSANMGRPKRSAKSDVFDSTLERSHKEHATLRSMPKPATWNNLSDSNTVVVTPNDEVERRGAAVPTNAAD